MKDNNFEQELNELVREIGGLPKPEKNKIIELTKRTHDAHEKLKKSVDNLQSSLDYLRVSIKYMMFDLEATRRENKYLKKLLDDQGD